jgi:hypothetical protein
VGVAASVTVSVKVVVVRGELGVPVIAPVDEFRDRLDGSDGDMEYESGAVPPAPVTGVNGVRAVPAVTVLDETATVEVSGPGVVTELEDPDDIPVPTELIAATVNE